MLSPDYSKRDYLLPAGCKDLIDVLKLEQEQGLIDIPKLKQPPGSLGQVGQPLSPMTPPKGDILVSDDTTAGEFAAILGKKASTVIADAMLLGVFANVKTRLPFNIMAQIARSYGFTIRKKL